MLLFLPITIYPIPAAKLTLFKHKADHINSTSWETLQWLPSHQSKTTVLASVYQGFGHLSFAIIPLAWITAILLTHFDPVTGILDSPHKHQTLSFFVLVTLCLEHSFLM